MRRLFGRETFIALRARRQGHRIAQDFVTPPMPPVIEPLQPKSDFAVEQFLREQRREAKRAERTQSERQEDRHFWIILGSMIFIIFIMIFFLRMSGLIR